jgi:prepilin-type N-terminal cleavage/methylation domain-containing protein
MKKAFSLIELSIVILIIGILIAGVTQSSRLIEQFNLSSATSLTKSSPVASIKDLYVWFEATNDDSFLNAEEENGLPISIWYDMNPQSISKINGTQGTGANQPLFTTKIINGLPAIKFDGTNDIISFDGTGLAGTNLTVFIVEKKNNSIVGKQVLFGGSGAATSTNLHIAYNNNSTEVFFATYNSDVQGTGTAALEPVIHSGTLSSTAGMSYYRNGTLNATDASKTALLTSYASAALGQGCCTGGVNYNGYIGEFIIFSRALKTEERQAVEAYLGKKWKIKVS